MSDHLHEKYLLGDADFYHIRNRNEARVLRMMEKVFEDPPGLRPNDEDLHDIYALALNSLPARYAQKGSIVLRDPVRDADVLEAVRKAVAIVVQNPKQ